MNLGGAARGRAKHDVDVNLKLTTALVACGVSDVFRISTVRRLHPMTRQTPRKPVNWQAVAQFGVARASCTIVNISTRGAKLQLNSRVEMGPYGFVASDKFGSLSARLVWQKGNFAGVAFTESEAEEVLGGRTTPNVKHVAPARFGRSARAARP